MTRYYDMCGLATQTIRITHWIDQLKLQPAPQVIILIIEIQFIIIIIFVIYVQVHDVLRITNVSVRPLADEYRTTTCHYDVVINSASTIQKMTGYKFPEHSWLDTLDAMSNLPDKKFVNVKGRIVDCDALTDQYDIDGNPLKMTKIIIEDTSAKTVI